ncbi:MAG TPA: M56 family metallopeptidase [Phycisphaerae bacterium]|nr:M56 family metallopeptidase [Phycisphaerae bacterium]
MTWLEWTAQSLWQNAWIVLLVASAAGAAARLSTRPATRHGLWSVVLLSFLLPLVMPVSPLGESLRIVENAQRFTADARGEPLRESQSRAPEAQPTQPALTVDSWLTGAPSDAEAERRGGAGRWAHSDGSRNARLDEAGPRRSLHPEVAAAQPPPRSAPPPSAAPSSATDAPASAIPEPRPQVPDAPKPGRAGAGESLAAEAPQEYPPGANEIPWAPTAAGVDSEFLDSEPAISHAPAADLSFAWLAALATVRNVLGRLPAMPPALWALGASAILLATLARMWWFSRRLRPVGVTPPWVQREAEDIAGQLGMNQAPPVLMVGERISPLVWCVGGPRVYLPLELWRQLDRAGRRAILCHELAHLHRRDHWVCWLELLVTVLYWWHPVVWWVRHRLHEEADLSCDAWVTWLMPRRRRAYAEALLHTREFIGSVEARPPVVGAAVGSRNARQLARRLTMVMTQQTRPRHSLVGLGMTAALVTLAWIAAPAFSCPPEEKQKAGSKAETPLSLPALLQAETGATRLFSTAAPSGAVGSLTAAPSGAIGSMIAAPAQGGAGGSSGSSASWVVVPQGGVRPTASGGGGFFKGLSGQKVAETALPVFSGAGGVAVAQPGLPTQQAPLAAALFSAGVAREGERTLTRSYRLPPGKLRALCDLMARDDVPILVNAGNTEIEVIATPRQHEVFAAFVEMIHPGSARQPFRTRARATPAPPAAPSAPMFGGASAPPAPVAPVPPRPMLESQLKREREAATVRGMAQREAAEALRRQADAARNQRDVHIRRLQEQSEALRRQADQLREQSQRLQEEVRRMQERMSEGEPDEQVQRVMRRQVRDLEREMRRVEQQVEETTRRAVESRETADVMERGGAELDEEIDELEESLHAVGARLWEQRVQRYASQATAADVAAEVGALFRSGLPDGAPGHMMADLEASRAAELGAATATGARKSDFARWLAQYEALAEAASGDQAARLAAELSELAARLSRDAERLRARGGTTTPAPCTPQNDGDDNDDDGGGDDDDDDDGERRPRR